MEPPRKLPPKKEVMIALLAESNVFVHLDPRRPGVIVPKWLQNQADLTLQLGLNMPIPIPDLEVEDDGISCTLSFSRTPFWVKIPWSAVFAIVSEKDRRGVVWPEDVPSESQLARGTQKAPPPKARPKLTALGPNDRLVRPDEPADEPEESESSELHASSDEASILGDERTPTADAKCASCATRWPEEQSSCPVCGATEWVDASGSQASEEATPDPAPQKAQRPMLVEGNPNAKKRSAARVRAKTNSHGTTARVVGPQANGPRADGSRKTSRPRPELVSDREGSEANAGPSSDAPRVPTTLALFPPRMTSETTDDAKNATKPTTPSESDSTETPDPEQGNKKPSKRPLPPYLRVVK